MVTQANISLGNSKIGKIPNISLPPVKSCGNCSSCAKACYALKAYRMYPAVRAAWDANFALVKTSSLDQIDNAPMGAAYFASIDAFLARRAPLYFRWHVSGDILDQAYLAAMMRLAKAHPGTRFLVFTKMHHLDYSRRPANLSVVFSMFPTMPNPRTKVKRAWYQDGTEKRIPQGAMTCPGSCSSCKACWTTSRDVVFNKH